MSFVACGGNDTGSSATGLPSVDPTFVYVFAAENAGSAAVEAFRMDPESGALQRSWSGAVTEFRSVPYRIAHPSGRYFVFAGYSTDPVPAGARQVELVAAYRVDRQTGALQLASRASGRTVDGVGGVSGPAVLGGIVTVTLNESLVFSIAPRPGDVTTHRFDAVQGVLTLAGPPFAVESGTRVGIAHPSRPYLYASPLTLDFPGESIVGGYSADAASGRLTSVPGSPFLGGPHSIAPAMHPSGRFLYLVGDLPSAPARRESCFCQILEYAVDAATGTLQLVPGTPLSLADPATGRPFTPTYLQGDPVGRFVYALSGNRVWALSVDQSTGKLQPMAGGPVDDVFGGASQGGPAAFEPSGRFRYGLVTNTVQLQRVDPVAGRFTLVQPGVQHGLPNCCNQLLAIQLRSD